MRGTIGLIALLAGLAFAAPYADATSHARKPAAVAPATAAPPARTEEAPLKEEGGGFVVPVEINDSVKLDFVLDSGAAVVTIPADVAMTLIRTGTLTRDDFLGSAKFQMADGRTVPSQILRIHSLRVGGIVVHDVQASVTDTKGGLLLGQTFLARLTTWSIDNSRHVLVLGPERPGGPPPLQLASPSHPRRSSKRGEGGKAPAGYASAPSDQAGGATAANGRPETAKSAAWDADFYQTCLSGGAQQPGVTATRAQTVCHCVVGALQPLPLSRKKRLVTHSHEVLAAEAQCNR
jgi:clan AA aspartic protease (TIGR02281 family)